MISCAYCGSVVQNKYCAYCEMTLSDRYILEDGKRLSNAIEELPHERDMFKSTKELLQLETIELLCLLRYARQYRSEIYNVRLLTHKAGTEDEELKTIQDQTYSDYEDATRKVWVIENILKDRIGYYPKKINDDFINRYNARIKQSEKNRMTIRSKINKKQA